MDEWRAALASRADFPETHLQIGGSGLTTRNWQLAERAFAEAASLDPQLVDAWTMIVRIRAATGDAAGARTALEEALAKNPGNATLQALGAEIGAGP
jgi:cytochrome c-type biogenesis protein CcmH/NrfG